MSRGSVRPGSAAGPEASAGTTSGAAGTASSIGPAGSVTAPSVTAPSVTAPSVTAPSVTAPSVTRPSNADGHGGDVRTVTVSGARIRVRETGDPAAPPVLLLHGIGRSLEDWDLQHPLLSDAYRVISCDLAGFGLSDRLPVPASLSALADGVLGVLEALGETRPVHLMGNSLGGAVSLTLLARAPSRVATLVLADPAGFGTEVTPILRVLGIPVLGTRLLRSLSRPAARHVERSLFVDHALVTPARVDLALEAGRRPDFVSVFAEIVKELGTIRGVRPGWRSSMLDAAARHPRPTLVVWGERDLILPVSHLRAALAAIPHARTHVFGRTGHMPQIERPSEFAALARDFLAARPSPGGRTV